MTWRRLSWRVSFWYSGRKKSSDGWPLKRDDVMAETDVTSTVGGCGVGRVCCEIPEIPRGTPWKLFPPP